MISPSERPSDWNEAAPLIPRNGGATAAALIDDNDADPKLKEAVSLTLVSSTPLERPRRPTSARRAPPSARTEETPVASRDRDTKSAASREIRSVRFATLRRQRPGQVEYQPFGYERSLALTSW
ncbi:UNVERIFIED_CONTAM: hypothetical protein RMT77_018143 [Armadillidium vulgare]